MLSTKYLIIGNGIGGLSAAKEIRNLDKDASITIVGSESSLTYYRVKLTDLISKEFELEDILVNKESWYKENDINVILNRIVENINIDNSEIKLDDGMAIGYEKLLIATGSRPFVPPINGKFKEGVFALRTVKDLLVFKEYLKPLNSVSVIGGGLLGLEAAWSLKKLGKEVNIIEFAPYLLPRQLDREISKKLEEKLRDLGFNIYLDSQVEEILGEGKVNGLLLKEGMELNTEAVLVSSGVRPNLDLVRETNIESDKGIKVDKHMKTNVDNVYAAGDVVEINGMVLGLWTAANEQGKIAGANMAGENKEYLIPKLFTNMQIGDVKLFSAGEMGDYDKVYEFKDGDIHHKIFTKEGLIQGTILFGDIKQMAKFKDATVSKMPIKDFPEAKDFI